jgi:hypothetical protein
LHPKKLVEIVFFISSNDLALSLNSNTLPTPAGGGQQ